jgi:phospholipid/cholesterol/gamma-HCH transport system substrate-binding protein
VAASDLRSVVAAADSLMTELQTGKGTLGMLARDSTLYHETTQTVIQLRQLLTEIQANPKKYLKISVF